MPIAPRPKWLCVLGLAACIASPAPAERVRVFGGPFPRPGGAGPAADAPDGLHLPQGRQVGFTTQLQDGGGNRWDLQNGLNIGSGQNHAYSGGMYLQVHGTNVYSPGHGWTSADGNEIEIGPWHRSGGVYVYRRCKIYPDRPLARWLDIFINHTANEQTVPVRIYSSYNASVSRTITSSGDGTFGQKDFAFITVPGSGRPPLLHVVCGPRAELRPDVRVSGNCLYVSYQVTVPPQGTAVLCYFESQGASPEGLQRLLKKLRPHRLLRDLPGAVRRLIVNFRLGGLLEQIDLDRSGTADTVVLTNDDAIQGRIVNEAFELSSLHGKLTLPAAKLIGFVAVGEGEDGVRAVLVNGQVVTGSLGEAAVRLALPTGGELKIPCARIRQCAYRVTKAKPDEAPFTDPLILLRNGDRLAFDAAQLRCALQTRHGRVALSGKDLVQVRLDHEAHGVHRAVFRNGSVLGGLLVPEKIALPIKLGTQLDIPRDMVLALRFAAEDDRSKDLTRVELTNDDELFGRLADASYALVTDFGTVTVKPANILAMAFDPFDPGRVAVTLWNGRTTLRGRLQQETLRFAIRPGPELDLHVGQIVDLTCPNPLPPDDVVKEVRRQVARLSAAGYKDREEAQETLIRMGPGIAPLLRKYLADSDPEVRQRVRVILERLGVDVGAGARADPPPVLPGGRWCAAPGWLTR